MKFGQYELLARIAVGGMAEVYEGRAVRTPGAPRVARRVRVAGTRHHASGASALGSWGSLLEADLDTGLNHGTEVGKPPALR